jgi:hypothetical protein
LGVEPGVPNASPSPPGTTGLLGALWCKAGGRPFCPPTDVRLLIDIHGRVSNVAMDGNNVLEITAIGIILSTFETLPNDVKGKRKWR